MALQTKTISANGSNGHHKFTLTVTENSTNIEKNTSSISWSFKLAPIKTGYDWYYSNTTPVSYSVKINGTTYSGKIMEYNGSSTVTLESGSATIAHNADGDKSINFSFSVTSLNVSYLTGSASKSGSMDLTTIPRAASITAAPNFNDEENPTITYLNPAGDKVTSLQACISITGDEPDIAYRDIDKAGTTYTFNLTDAERKVLRQAVVDANSMTVYFYVKTVIGGSTYYKKLAKTFTLINYTPTLAPVVKDTNSASIALTGDSGKIIKYFNYVQVTTGAQARKEATLASQTVSCGNSAFTSATGYFSNVDTNIFNFSASDSRGYITTKIVEIPMVEYIKLTCNLEAQAPNAAGTMDITINGNYFNGSFGAVSNSLTVKYRVKENNGDFGEWVTAAASVSSDTYSATATITGLNYQSSYTIEAAAIDAVNTGGVSSGEIRVKTTPVFDWGENDFNFNVPVTIQGDLLNDYVIEEGNNGSYAYRKWRSGLMEAWRSAASTVEASATAAYGAMYYADGLALTTVGEASQFVSVESVQMTVNKKGAMGLWLPVVKNWSVSGGSVTINYSLLNPAQTTANIMPCVYIIGRWK